MLDYLKFLHKKRMFIFLLIVILFISIIISINIGSSSMTIKKSVLTLFGFGDELSKHIIFNIRLRRVIGGIFVGIGISFSGMLMQSVLNNPLASPSTLGISNASAFGANFAIILLANFGAKISPLIVSFSSFITAMVCMILVLLISNLNDMVKSSIILAGVAFGAIFSAGTTIVQYFADDIEVASAVFWTFGDLERISYKEIIILGVILAISVTVFYYMRWQLNCMDMGDATAHSLGVDIRRFRNLAIIVSALNTSVSVAFVGMIGFVGLLAPQVTKRIIGEDKRYMFPATLLMGALVVLNADTLARTIIAPLVLPVGSITSFLGGPLFLYILIKDR